MSFLDTMRYKLKAALSPSQMVRQQSRPNIKKKDDWINYKQDGLGWEDYDKMLKDSQIKSGYELLRTFLLSRKLIVTPSDDTPESEEISKDLESMLYGMKYPLRKVRNDIYTAIVYGYYVGEIIWGLNEDNDRIDIKRIRPIPIDTLEDCFVYDDNGDLEKIKQQDPEGGDDIEIDPDKCLIYTYDEQFGDRSGNSILDAVYDNYFMKQKLLQWYQVYLQKHEGPTLVGYVENPAYKNELQDALDDVHEGRANITAGMNDRVEVLESSHRGEAFKEAINYHDVMIYRKMNIGTMILGQENGQGAYAQSKTQNDVLSIFLDGIHEDIAAELQLICNKWIDMHYNVENYPKISFETFEEKDILGLIGALKPLIDVMAVDPRDKWFKQLLSDAVQKFSDVDMKEFLSDEMEESQGPEEQQVVPTLEEQSQSLSEEQRQPIEEIAKLIPAKEE
jgi:hypothetical protein